MTYLKVAQKVDKYLGYFHKAICCHELSKIGQSGHTANSLRFAIRKTGNDLQMQIEMVSRQQNDRIG